MARVTVTGLKEALASLDPVTANVSVFRGISKWALTLHRALVTHTYMTTKGGNGNMARRWFVRPTAQQNGMLLRVGNSAKYSGYVEHGTRPHVIRPRWAKVLRWRSGGRAALSAFRVKAAGASSNFIFAREVHHPGTRPMRIFQGTFDASKDELATDIMTEIQSSKAAAGA